MEPQALNGLGWTLTTFRDGVSLQMAVAGALIASGLYYTWPSSMSMNIGDVARS